MQAATPSQTASSSETPAQRVRRILFTPDGRLSQPNHRAVLELDAEAVPALISVLTNESLDAEDSPGEGHARERAAMLLGELRATEAVEPMIAVLRTTDPLSTTHEATMKALPRLGPAVIEPVLAAYADSMDPELHIGLMFVLSHTEQKDPRILSVLLDHLRKNPEHGAMCLAAYGDSEALPALSVALDAQPVYGVAELVRNQPIVELCAAIGELGGTLTPSQQRKRADVAAVRSMLFDRPAEQSSAQEPLRRPPKVGRNDPCTCGSGKKYKKCCGS